MCDFFSLISNPKTGDIHYANWTVREAWLKGELPDMESPDSHTSLAKYFGYSAKREDLLNKYEYNPLTGKFKRDHVGDIDDSASVEVFCRGLDFKRIVPMLVIKPIINPFTIEPPEITEEVKELLKQWASVGASVGASVWDSVWASVWASVRDSVWASVGYSVWASVGDSVRAYISSFFSIQYGHDFSSCVKLWEMGLVPSFDGKTWRLHGGKDAKILYEVAKEAL